MAPKNSIANICKARNLRHREDVRIDLREKLAAIENAAGPLPDDDDPQRPFMLPLGHDPYDIWSHILDRVTDPKDISSLWEVCPLFREMLKCKRKYVQTKLPTIIQFILDNRPKFLLEDEDDDEEAENDVSPYSLTLLNLRFISKQCKSSVEELLFQPQPVGIKATKLHLTLKTAEEVQDIIDSILGSEIIADSFFPPKVVVNGFVTWNNDQQRLALFEAIGTLLELVGKRLKTFGYDGMDTPQVIYDKLREWVLYMPNLENLEWESLTENTVFPFVENLPAFPHCPQLKSFKLKWRMVPNPYLQHIFEANPNIKEVSLPKYSRITEYGKLSEVLPSFQQLECVRAQAYTALFSQLEVIPPLKEIVLYGNTLSASEVLLFTNPFRDSLLRLELKDAPKWTGTYFLDLPNLRFFKSYYSRSFDFQFLLHARRLEEIQMVVKNFVPHIKVYCDRLDKKITKGFDGLSIWEVFPRLKRFFTKFPWEGKCRALHRQ